MKRSGNYGDYDLVAQFYDHVVPYNERQDITFFVEMAKSTGGPVLELGCGTGRVLISTAREGIEIVGLDDSEQMLSICREKVSRETEAVRARVTLVQGDMRAFDLGRRFALVTIPFRPFQHLASVEEELECLACIHRHLEERGRLVLDLFNPSLPRLVDEGYRSEMGDEPEFTMPDGRRVLRRYRVASRDRFEQVLDCELIYYITHPDGRSERLVHAFPMRYLFRFEAEHLLCRAGFEIEALYADHDKSPFGSRDPGDLVFVARKP